MAHQQSGHAAVENLTHLVSALLAERAVADRQHLVEDDDVRIDQTGDGKREPALHAARQLLELIVLEVLKLGKINDLVVFCIHESPGVAEERAAQVGVLPHRHVSVKTRCKLQECCDIALDLHGAERRDHDSGDRLEQRGFPGAVAADDAEHVAALQCERDVLVRPELLDMIIVSQLPDHGLLQADRLEISCDVADADIFTFNRGGCHIDSPCGHSARWCRRSRGTGINNR